MDEAYGPDGAPRAAVRAPAGGPGRARPGRGGRAVAAALEPRTGWPSAPATSARPFHVDPVPRLIGAEEWAATSAGLTQRARALAAFLADVYGDGRIVAAGRGTGAGDRVGRLPRARRARRARCGRRASSPGLDLVRGDDGQLRGAGGQHAHPVGRGATPSGARRAVDRRAGRPGAARAAGRRRTCSRSMASALARCAPDARRRPVRGHGLRRARPTAPGTSTGSWPSHMGLPLVTPADLSLRGDRLHAARRRRAPRAPSTWSTAAPTRTACATSEGRPTWLHELLLPARARRAR